MDEGPVAETMTGPIRELFDDRQFITDVSGSGNNWYYNTAHDADNKTMNILLGLMDTVCTVLNTKKSY